MGNEQGIGSELTIFNEDGKARLSIGNRDFVFDGRWITGGPWDRFGFYDSYVIVRHDGQALLIPAHAGELVPGSTEDLVAYLRALGNRVERPEAPLTLELDPTYQCTSRDCGGRCFSAEYRKLAPNATIPTPVLRDIIRDFSAAGGRILRFDGGGDPLAHPSVRNGELPELAFRLSLKTTILTSGDLLDRSDLHRIGRAGCYVRISLNAATDETRKRFHGNRISLRNIFSTIEGFADWLLRENISLPIGATYLLDTMNYHEVLACAYRARDAGISHFSVRRVLGPAQLRPSFSVKQELETKELLARVRKLSTNDFRVFVPWRDLDEPDLNPARGDLDVASCWQATFKTVIEPCPSSRGFRAQLCGRYRGGGIGQALQLPALFSTSLGTGWTNKWRESFDNYAIPRALLPHTCVSCIDRGFILMVNCLVDFLVDLDKEFRILHLQRSC